LRRKIQELLIILNRKKFGSKSRKLFTKVNSPVLTGLDLNFGSVGLICLSAQNTRLFRGTQLTLLGRIKMKLIAGYYASSDGKTQRNPSFNYDNLVFPLRAEDNNFFPVCGQRAELVG